MKPILPLMLSMLLCAPALAADEEGLAAAQAPRPTAQPDATPAVAPVAAPPTVAPDPTNDKFFLTLTQAIEIAEQNNHDIKLAEEKIADAKLQISETGSSGLPQLSITASYGRQDPVLALQSTDTSGSGGNALASNPQFAAFLGTASVNTFSSAVTLNQVLFEGFRIFDALKVANMNVDLQEQALRQTRQNVAFQVTSAYFTALRALEVVNVDKQSLTQSEEQIRVAEAKLKAGAGLKLDVLQARSQQIQVQQRLSMDLNSYEKAKMSLNQVIGRETVYPISLNTVASVAEYPIDAEKGLQTAIDHRADLTQLRLQKQMSETNATIQGRAVWPTVSAQVRYNLSDSAVAGGNNRSVSNINYGLNMNWPIFDGFAAQAKADRAEESAKQAGISLDQLQQKVILDIQQSLLDIQEAQERMQMAQVGVDVADENVRLAGVSYREGTGIMLNVITAQVTAEQARNALINARFDLNIRKARLYQALGLDIVDHLQ